MTKSISLILLLYLLVFLQSCMESEGSGSIESYKGSDISLTEVNDFLEARMDSLQIPGLSIAIINKGRIAYHNALGESNTRSMESISEGSIFEAASIVKPVQAFFAMKMSEKGIIDLDRPLHFYLPDEEMKIDPRYEEVSAKMVLSHRTGFPNWRWFDAPPEDLEINRGDFFMVVDPNTSFTYSGEAYSYLGRVLAHLNFVNMSELDALFQEEIAIPMGMKHAYTVWDDYLYENKVFGHKEGKPLKRKWSTGLPSQNSKFSGGLHTNAKSYAHFMTAVINEKGLYPETYKDMLSPYIEIPKGNVSFTEDGITHWSLGFGIKPMNGDTIYRHGGSNKGFQSEMAFSMNKKFGYVFFMNCEKGNEFNKELEQFLEIDK